MGFTSSWDMEQWQYVCAHITDFNRLSFQKVCFLCTPLLAFLFQVCLPKKALKYYLNGNTKNQKHES